MSFGTAMENSEAYTLAAEAITNADVLIVTAGAGMGVDSGLPDFRGDRGFWNAYPLYERLGINFVSAANPIHFRRDPAFGWGFYGHRRNLYRDTIPHEGFNILLRWIEEFSLNYFVVTSNVDGQFQKAGFEEERLLEVHGSIHYLQCATPCSNAIWENREVIPVDLDTMRAAHIPTCTSCRGVARPNILMFGDFGWISDRTSNQEYLFDSFLHVIGSDRIVVVELGAGTAIPTIRFLSERLGSRQEGILIRINPRESDINHPHISLPCGALDGLKKIDSEITALIGERRKSR